MIKKKVTTQKITTRLLLSLSPLWVLLTKKDTSRTFFFCKKEERRRILGRKLTPEERESFLLVISTIYNNNIYTRSFRSERRNKKHFLSLSRKATRQARVRVRVSIETSFLTVVKK